MNILVTGAAGFIGYNFCSKLLKKKKNLKLYGIDNINNYYSTKIKKLRLYELKKYNNFYFKKIDIKNERSLNAYFKNKKFDYIYHFAAQAGVRYSIINPKKYLDSNILGFFNLLENCKNKKIKKFFYASSSSVYGNSKKFPLSEKQNIKPINFYGLTKKNNEEMAENYSKYYNLKLIGLRFFTVYGEWGRPDMVIFKLLNSIFKKKTFQLNNKGNHYRDFTYIDNVTDVLFKLMQKKINKKHIVLNICSNNPIKLTYLLHLVKKEKLNLKFRKAPFQNADIFKTHGSNLLLKSIVGNLKFLKMDKGFNKCLSWYKKYHTKI